MSKLDVFRHCRFLRHAGVVMIGVVLALLSAVYYAVVSSYSYRFLQQSLWRKLVSALVIASFTLLVCSPCWHSLVPRSAGTCLIWHAQHGVIALAVGAASSIAHRAHLLLCTSASSQHPVRMASASLTGDAGRMFC